MNIPDPISNAIVGVAGKVLDRVIQDPQAKAEAQLKLLQMQGDQEIKLLGTQMSAIVAEAQSSDPWTSRARPSFLYVMYVLLLWSIPMGIISAFDPAIADRIVKGMTGYLGAIPEPLYALMGTGYLGYVAARQWGKNKGQDK